MHKYAYCIHISDTVCNYSRDTNHRGLEGREDYCHNWTDFVKCSQVSIFSCSSQRTEYYHGHCLFSIQFSLCSPDHISASRMVLIPLLKLLCALAHTSRMITHTYCTRPSKTVAGTQINPLLCLLSSKANSSPSRSLSPHRHMRYLLFKSHLFSCKITQNDIQSSSKHDWQVR